VISKNPKYLGTWKVDEPANNVLPGDKGLVVNDIARYHAISARITPPITMKNENLVVQYEGLLGGMIAFFRLCISQNAESCRLRRCLHEASSRYSQSRLGGFPRRDAIRLFLPYGLLSTVSLSRCPSYPCVTEERGSAWRLALRHSSGRRYGDGGCTASAWCW